MNSPITQHLRFAWTKFGSFNGPVYTLPQDALVFVFWDRPRSGLFAGTQRVEIRRQDTTDPSNTESEIINYAVFVAGRSGTPTRSSNGVGFAPAGSQIWLQGGFTNATNVVRADIFLLGNDKGYTTVNV
jgi:hypothetical protein